MEKRDLLGLIDETLKPFGFKRKGSYWVDNASGLTRLVHLQKSNFGEAYYVNYGYILKHVPLGNLKMHVYNRVSSTDLEERVTIEALLNFENDIPDDARTTRLREVLTDNLLAKIQSVHTEEDLLREIKSRPNLNAIPLTVKNYFGLG